MLRNSLRDALPFRAPFCVELVRIADQNGPFLVVKRHPENPVCNPSEVIGEIGRADAREGPVKDDELPFGGGIGDVDRVLASIGNGRWGQLV